MEEDNIKLIENWFIMLNTPEYDDQDAGMVRDEIREFLEKAYQKKLGMCPSKHSFFTGYRTKDVSPINKSKSIRLSNTGLRKVIRKDVLKHGFPFNNLNTKYKLRLVKKNQIHDIDFIKNKFILDLRKSISDSVGNEKRVGLFLSGGIDSNGLAIILGEYFKNVEVVAYVAVFEKNQVELQSARKIIKRYSNIKIKEVKITNKDIWQDIIERIGLPIADGASIPLFYLSKQASKDKLNIILTGDGNDELWCGYNWYYYMLKWKKRVPYFKKIGRYLENTNLPKIKILGQLMKHNNALDLLYEKYLFDLNIRIPYCWAEQRFNLIESFGLNLKMPYLSQSLVDLAYNVPIEIKIKKDNKWILKEALSVFNKDILDIRKREMGYPCELSIMKHRKKILRIWENTKLKICKSTTQNTSNKSEAKK